MHFAAPKLRPNHKNRTGAQIQAGKAVISNFLKGECDGK